MSNVDNAPSYTVVSGPQMINYGEKFPILEVRDSNWLLLSLRRFSFSCSLSFCTHIHTQICKSTGIKENVPLKLWYLHFQSLVKATTPLFGQLLDSEWFLKDWMMEIEMQNQFFKVLKCTIFVIIVFSFNMHACPEPSQWNDIAKFMVPVLRIQQCYDNFQALY